MNANDSVPSFALLAILIHFSGVCLPDDAHGQIDLAERETSVKNLELHIEQREARLEHLKVDIQSLDERVEGSIDEIVNMLIKTKDSEESKVRVAGLKEDVIKRLHNSIEYYDRHRNHLKEELRHDSTAIPREALQSDLAAFEARIEKRVKQINLIAESFTQPQDLEKYKVTGRVTSGIGRVTSRRSRGWGTVDVEEISEAWKQNRREAPLTETVKEEVLKGLQESIDHLTSRNVYLESKLKTQTISAAERELYEDDLGRNTAIIEVRKSQMSSVSISEEAVPKTAVAGDAHQMEMLIEDKVDDLRKDFFSIFGMYEELNKARAELKPLSDNLAARKQWLADYYKKNP